MKSTLKKHLIALALLVAPCVQAQEINMFNGRDLTGWDGLKQFWSVKDGAITGTTTAKNAAKDDTFLVWNGGGVEDFELTCKFKMLAGDGKGFCNSGIQFRSRVVDPSYFGMSGYQADMDIGPQNYTGMLYEQKGRSMLATTGQKVKITDDGSNPKKIDVIGSLGDPSVLLASFRAGEWHDCKVVAIKEHIQIFINGRQTVDVIDLSSTASRSGLIGLQIHKRAPMTVQFKDLKLRRLIAADPTFAATAGTTAPAPGNPQATTHKPEQPQIRILSDESVNVTGWITSPLEVSVPEQIWENLNFLKEALRDEAAQKPAANAKAYGLANFLCARMLRYLEERDQFTARGGGAAVLHQKSNLTQGQRDHLTWPQFALERDERTERHENARNAPKFQNGNALVEWNTRKTIIRREMESAYSDFREALRQSPPAK